MAKDTILIADDDRTAVTLMAAFFRKEGFVVVPAFDAAQAMMAASRAPFPNAIILDVSMPGGTGLDVLKKLKAKTKTSQIPIIIVSGSLEPGVHEEIRGLGAEEFLPKPVDLEQLRTVLLKALGRPT